MDVVSSMEVVAAMEVVSAMEGVSVLPWLLLRTFALISRSQNCY